MTGLMDYKGKRVIVSGCYSGMGAATARQLLDLGAEVHGLDYQDVTLPLASFTSVDLRDRDAIDAAAGKLEGEFDALFNCAGVPSTFAPADICKINFVGTRYLTGLVLPKIRRGGAVSCIASTAGFAWGRKIELIKSLLADTTWDGAVAWFEKQLAEGADAYSISKEAVIIWTLQSSSRTIANGIRMNCILPGPTVTPFMEKQTTITSNATVDAFTQPINRRSTPEEQAAALLFLNSEAASYVNGVALPVDGGFVAGVTTGEVDLMASLQAAAAQ